MKWNPVPNVITYTSGLKARHVFSRAFLPIEFKKYLMMFFGDNEINIY
jgi:hypothetical protein